MTTIQLLENAYCSLLELSKIDGNAATARRDLYLAIEQLKAKENTCTICIQENKTEITLCDKHAAECEEYLKSN